MERVKWLGTRFLIFVCDKKFAWVVVVFFHTRYGTWLLNVAASSFTTALLKSNWIHSTPGYSKFEKMDLQLC